MSTYLFAVFASFLLNFILIVPFINFLYQLKFQRQQQKTKDFLNRPTPIFDKFNRDKNGTPVGGGILVLLTTIFVFFFLAAVAFKTNSNLAEFINNIKEFCKRMGATYIQVSSAEPIEKIVFEEFTRAGIVY